MHDLKQLAEIALKISRASLKKSGAGGVVIVLGYPDGTTKQLSFPDELAEMLNDGGLKDILFAGVRKMVQETGADAVVFATECWRGKSTPAAMDMPQDEFMRLSAEHKFESLVQMGYVTREEALVATAQNADNLVTCTQSFRRLSDGMVYSYGEVEVREVPQSAFYGRQKMFGDLKQENLR
jgi:hypothetical protein